MKRTLALLILMTCALAGALAQETTLQVAPSEQVIYPDPNQILNKTEPKADTKAEAGPLPPATATAPVASTKPLASTTPLPARLPAPDAKGWYLRWSFTGDEAAVQAWAKALGREVRLVSTPTGWEAWQGPLTASELSGALVGQVGKATLVKK